uniref:signal peptidase I n=1 Tax=Ningiella ruwaisensis TaxID=2364274 RepID=UPI00109F41E8|nr:signal peptidase I [Ningiella ruwaisensis]
MANYFSIFLVAASAFTGMVWLVYAWFIAPKKEEATSTVSANTAQTGNSSFSSTKHAQGVDDELPWLVDISKQFFPIFFGVMIFRSFIYEPFQIPSGSMMPTLLEGDFILVEKFAYGLKDPVTRTEFFETGEVKRGDIVVFKYPLDTNVDYIKRVVGLPGETIIYSNKQVFIQAPCEPGQLCERPQPVDLKSLGDSEFKQRGAFLDKFVETLGEKEHEILHSPLTASAAYKYDVPEGHYFVLGDNRDNSQDSRYWGFVPEENLVGKATFIWISFDFDRSEEDFLPTWLPSGVRFERIGSIH